MCAIRQLRKRENTRERLVEAAIAVFEDKGLAGARIDDVVAKAGFTRGAFYSNYSSLTELLHEAVIGSTSRVLQEVREAISAIEGPTNVDNIMEILDRIRPHGRTLYILVTELKLHRIRNPESPLAVEEDVGLFLGEIAEIIESILKQMRRRSTIDPEQIANIFVVFFLESISEELVLPSRVGGRDVLRTMVETTLRSLSEPID